MVLMAVSLDNIYGFKDFKINFSYPRKLKNSTIKEEFLKSRPNFKYKKAVVFLGANATGKTTFGRALNAIFNYVNTGNSSSLLSLINNPLNETSFSIDFVNLKRLELIRFKTVIGASVTINDISAKIESFYASSEIRMTDSYESCSKELDAKGLSYILPAAFSTVFGPIGFRFNLSYEQDFYDLSLIREKDVFLETLKCVLRTLDCSITSIEKSGEFDDSYIIKGENSQILIQKGELQDSRKILSTGTKEGINIAILLAAIRLHLNGFYYCDEQFSHIQSDVEKRLLAIMIDSLSDGEQLFFTTHNPCLMEMNIPNHSFAFFRKEKTKDSCSITITYASEKLKRDTDSVKCAADNDVFNTLPDDTLLNELEERLNDGW